MKRLTKKQIEDARLTFWIVWTILISVPVSWIGWLFSGGSWWGSPIAVIISVVTAYNVFEFWLKRRQETADNTLILCYCGHTASDHDPEKCWHSDSPIGQYTRDCLCGRYTPRFWQMLRRT